ncbi:Kinetochore protein NUF2 [Actinidia chinensis var. chinensis]|uniref:Kinetochore protein NUF2 n=1 Tax=Actinidia chinensis var. chinensis TaxID=1590841 RepID=A0A2R6RGK0_ACTCC|nr:Kinetochore protein NUF2 [Actinidia chinensis var. chinensis]
MSKYGFPKLPRSDIIEYLEEAKIASEADLLKPKPDFVQNLYTKILFRLCSLQDDHGQVDFAALERLENPDLHVDSVRIMNLFGKVKEILTAMECPMNICLKDLLKPDKERTEFFVGVLLNFCIHRENKMLLLGPIVDDTNLLDDQRQELEGRISQLDEEIAEHNESRERELPLVQDVEAKVKELHQTIAGLNNHQVSLKASIRKMKDKAKEMDEKISSAEFALVQSVQENASLRSKIVQSPDKLQRALEEKKLVRIEAKNAERAAMQSFQEKTAVHEVYTKACKKLSKNLAQMQAIQEQVNSAKSIEKDVKVLKVKQSDEGMLDKSLEAKLVERQGKVEQLEEIRKQLEKEKDLRYGEATKEFNIVKSEVEARRHDLKLRQTKVEAGVAEGDAIIANINSVKESGAAQRQELSRKCEEIVSEFYKYSKSIGALLPMIEAEPEL